MSESDFYTVNHRYEAQGAPREWPTWELRAHGSAAPAPGPAAPDEATGSDGRGCPLPRLDPLGPWCSARLTFTDGARIDVLVAVSDDHITVEDVRADPPLRLDGLADLARWIEGPLDDAFRAATGRPRKSRPAPRQAGPAGASPDRSGPTARTARELGVMSGPTHEPTATPAQEPGAGMPHDPSAGTPQDASAATPHDQSAGPGPATQSMAQQTAHPMAEAGARAERATGPMADVVTEAPKGPAAESLTGLAPGQEPAPAREPTGAGATTAPPGVAAGEAATEPKPEVAAPGEGAMEGPEERAGSALLARSRAAERRKLAADAYRQAQREGRDPVLAVMLATGRNRRRSLRLIAGARDEGLLTPRHNKR